MSDFQNEYKGRRLHIRKGEEVPGYDFEIFDANIGLVFGYCNELPDKSWEGIILFGPHEIPVYGSSARDLAKMAYEYLKSTILKG